MVIFKSWFADFEPFKNEKFVYGRKLSKETPEKRQVKKYTQLIHQKLHTSDRTLFQEIKTRQKDIMILLKIRDTLLLKYF